MPNPNFLMIKLQLKMYEKKKLLGITIDNKLTFKSHLKNICKEANQKLNALVRIAKFTFLFQNLAEFLHKVSIFTLPSNF